MTTIITEKNGSRKFERISRWNTLDYTIISRNNRLAEYSDNYESKADKLNITCFKIGSVTYPLNRFGKLDKAIVLDDLSNITRYDPETGFFMEVNGDKSKVRLFKAIA